MAADASSAAGAPVRASWRSDRDVVWLLTLWTVSYTHLTLPTILRV